MHWFICAFVHLSICAFVHLCICAFVHLCICAFGIGIDIWYLCIWYLAFVHLICGIGAGKRKATELTLFSLIVDLVFSFLPRVNVWRVSIDCVRMLLLRFECWGLYSHCCVCGVIWDLCVLCSALLCFAFANNMVCLFLVWIVAYFRFVSATIIWRINTNMPTQTPLYSTPLYSTPLHFTQLHYTPLHYTTPHGITPATCSTHLVTHAVKQSLAHTHTHTHTHH